MARAGSSCVLICYCDVWLTVCPIDRPDGRCTLREVTGDTLVCSHETGSLVSIPYSAGPPSLLRCKPGYMGTGTLQSDPGEQVVLDDIQLKEIRSVGEASKYPIQQRSTGKTDDKQGE